MPLAGGVVAASVGEGDGLLTPRGVERVVTLPPGRGLDERVTVGVGVGVGEGRAVVRVGVGVGLRVRVEVGVGRAVGVALGVGVAVTVGHQIAGGRNPKVGRCVGVGVGSSVRVGVGAGTVTVGVGAEVLEGSSDGFIVGLPDAVGIGSPVWPGRVAGLCLRTAAGRGASG